ncbi:glycoside hydrolase family 15 protein [Agromyces sp. ISL-38]|uniref:glycoside hydrolase family 15 protein n=1 Tax=Agromyces sp. ISL-38 TaxID=2819107 RepID=UPI001BE9E2B9|nr:glycoside hydrolase family 15 protein [Agromyces sp. ISL-38]MBT2498959.1 glycoside hydrolase family 15 protein [Agromyces sp. ISL-38]MBT2518494.1 glycoside hydrolase family 15 protein [Streptomyces sp. ISL-90]
MAMPIEAYAVIGDCRTAALIGSDGSIDWFCAPRFDAPSVFGALLGDEEQGRWSLRPADAAATGSRAYTPDTFTLVTRWVTAEGEVEVVEFMPRVGHGGGMYGAAGSERRSDVIRRVRGIRGRVVMQQELRVRFDYASSLPWMRQVGTAQAPALLAVAGPDALVVRGQKLVARDHRHVGDFTVAAGETVDVQLTWYPAHLTMPDALDVDAVLAATEAWWRSWVQSCVEPGAYDEAVRRSLLVLRLLTHEATGGIVAAATTSLPEDFGGVRNWDYRYVWLRDAALTLEALLHHGFTQEAQAWRGWLLRAIAGDPADVQIMYGLAGERRIHEWEVPTLPGHGGSAPVRVGNAASEQYQADIFGEVMIALDATRHRGIDEDRFSWSLQVALLREAERHLDRPDSGIWEIRGPGQHFTHSRAMLWAAFDRAICAVEHDGRSGPVDRWRSIRADLAARIERGGFDTSLGSYVQFEGSTEVDAALLQLAQIGYVAYDDPRMLGTVDRIERTLLRDGLLRRYRTEAEVDGVPGDENAFLACSFWLVEQYAHTGRLDEAAALMDRILGYRTDLGLLAEQADPRTGRQAGNTPQALSHLALVRAADAIAHARGIAAEGALASAARSSRGRPGSGRLGGRVSKAERARQRG